MESAPRKRELSSSATEPPPSRPPPDVIRVPPARETFKVVLTMTVRCTVMAYVAGGAALAIFATMLQSIGRGIVPLSAPDMVLPLVVAGVVTLLSPAWLFAMFAFSAWAHNRDARHVRERMFAAHPDLADDPRVAALVATLESVGRKYPALARVVCEHSPDGRTAHVVCLNGTDPPTLEDAPAEPFVTLPRQTPGAELASCICVLCWIEFAFFVVCGRMRSWYAPLLGVLGLIAGGVWFWKYKVSPRYVRFAPGVIQFLQYASFARWPCVKTVPLDEHAIVFVWTPQQPSRQRSWRIAVCRHDECTEIVFFASQEESESIWRALISTAPTPPLSDEFLVG